MKTIFYITISLAVSINACQENNSSKTTSENFTQKEIPDTLQEANVAEHKTEKETQALSDTNFINKTNATSDKRQEPFKLISAISENWTAGIPSGGSGTEYYFKIKIMTSDKIDFDTLWTNNKSFATFISKESTSISDKPIQFGKGDIITIRATELKNQNIKQAIVNSPIKYKGAALIGYHISGKREFFTVPEIKKQSSQNRP